MQFLFTHDQPRSDDKDLDSELPKDCNTPCGQRTELFLSLRGRERSDAKRQPLIPSCVRKRRGYHYQDPCGDMQPKMGCKIN